LEEYIDAEPAGDWSLRTSPEFHMKRLLAAGWTRIFQIGPCFRRRERGRRHLPEFSMLEWYRANADYRDVLADAQELLDAILRAVPDAPGGNAAFGLPWAEISVDEAFRRYAGRAVDDVLDTDDFDRVLTADVEPNLGRDRPTILIDYPAACAGFAKAKPADPGRVERWELYAGGLELANACTELTDPEEYLRRFRHFAETRRQRGRDVCGIDEAFMTAVSGGMPAAAGVALGLDRLLMLLAGVDDIAQVVAFTP